MSLCSRSLRSLRAVLSDPRGAAMVEYALLIGCAGLIGAAGAKMLGLSVKQGATYLATMV